VRGSTASIHRLADRDDVVNPSARHDDGDAAGFNGVALFTNGRHETLGERVGGGADTPRNEAGTAHWSGRLEFRRRGSQRGAGKVQDLFGVR
jgi:hypothetical protein